MQNDKFFRDVFSVNFNLELYQKSGISIRIPIGDEGACLSWCRPTARRGRDPPRGWLSECSAKIKCRLLFGDCAISRGTAV